MSKFVVFERVSEAIFRQYPKESLTASQQTQINLFSGLMSGFAAAFVSQPADTMLSKINKTKGLPGEGTMTRLIKIGGELGLRGSFTGLGARLFMVGTLTAYVVPLLVSCCCAGWSWMLTVKFSGQFGLYASLKDMMGARGGTEIAK